MPRAYYNDNDPKICAWLRELIRAGLIMKGDVDERPIQEVRPKDLRHYAQCHFFAGIGGWAYALKLAGWDERRPVWTGSCPCQPFSSAGKGKGAADARHLWPEWWRLIRQSRPPTIFGEQVASKAARTWYDAVCADVESVGYAIGAADLCAASVGAFHIRQRLWFVADANIARSQRRRLYAERTGKRALGPPSMAGALADAECRYELRARRGRAQGTTSNDGWRGRQVEATSRRSFNFWSSCHWLPCADGKARPVEPGTFPLAHGVPARVGRLRGYGNAIVAELAAAFVQAYLETEAETE